MKKKIKIISDPMWVQKILKDEGDLFERVILAEPVRRVFGKGIGSGKGAKYSAQRRAILPFFSAVNQLTWSKEFERKCNELMAEWGNEIDLLFETRKLSLGTFFSVFGKQETVEHEKHIIDLIESFYQEHKLPIFTPIQVWRLRKIANQFKRKGIFELLNDAEGISTFFLASTETVAASVSWVVAHLLEYPEQRKSALASEAFLTAFILEVLRLYPPLWSFNFRRKDSGEFIRIPVFDYHRDEKIWDSPEQFKPERFFNSKPEPFHYLAFGAGKHQCIGYEYSLSFIRHFVKRLFDRFDVESKSTGLPEPEFGITLRPKTPVCLRLKLRTIKEEIQIQTVSKKDVYRFACDYLQSAKEGDLIPVTKSRALAWGNNPLAADDDIAMVLAYHAGKLVGYGGAIAGRLRCRDGSYRKVIFPTSGFVIKEYQSRHVGGLMAQKVKDVGKHVVLYDVVDRFDRFIQKHSSYKELGQDGTTTIHLNRLNPIGFISRRVSSKFLTRLASALQVPIRRAGLEFLGLVLSRKRLDKGNTYFERPREVLEWMLRFPWFEADSKYHFGNANREEFRFFERDGAVFSIYKLKSSDEVKLRVLDFEPGSHPVNAAIKLAIQKKVDHLEFPTALVPKWLVHFHMATEKRGKYFYWWNENVESLEKELEGVSLSHCDGERPFLCP